MFLTYTFIYNSFSNAYPIILLLEACTPPIYVFALCQICLQWPFTTKMLVVHMQCLLRVGGSILACVLVLCLSLYIPQAQQVTAYWYSKCSSAASSTKSTVASFKNFTTRGGRYRTIDSYTVVSNRHSYSSSNCCCNGVL